jgi:hypothetical protein
MQDYFNNGILGLWIRGIGRGFGQLCEAGKSGVKEVLLSLICGEMRDDNACKQAQLDGINGQR